MFKEECWILYGFFFRKLSIGFLVYDCKGNESSINFDWKKSLAKHIIGWFHTHPPLVALEPSPEDRKTMRSWVRTLNKPLFCGISHDQRKSNCFLFKRHSNSFVFYEPIKHKIFFKKIFIGFC